MAHKNGSVYLGKKLYILTNLNLDNDPDTETSKNVSNDDVKFGSKYNFTFLCKY